MGQNERADRKIPDEIAQRVARFRRSLREDDRPAFDRLIERARLRAATAAHEAALDPSKFIFLSILLDQEREIELLQAALDEVSWTLRGRPATSKAAPSAFLVVRRKAGAGAEAPAPLARI